MNKHANTVYWIVAAVVAMGLSWKITLSEKRIKVLETQKAVGTQFVEHTTIILSNGYVSIDRQTNHVIRAWWVDAPVFTNPLSGYLTNTNQLRTNFELPK